MRQADFEFKRIDPVLWMQSLGSQRGWLDKDDIKGCGYAACQSGATRVMVTSRSQGILCDKGEWFSLSSGNKGASMANADGSGFLDTKQ